MNSSHKTETAQDLKHGIESRSIDYVPHTERKGRVSDQATIWFAGSAQLLSLATGAIGISLGLNLGWTLIALAIGTLLGTIPVSAHATQGPHLGLPQMIQSRPQFGRYGALLFTGMAVVVYWGYIVVGGDLLGSTTATLTGTENAPLWAVAMCVAAVLLAIIGYHWLHIAQRLITQLLVLVIIVYVIGLIARGEISASLFNLTEGFELPSFLIVVSAATGYQLTWAFFVSDYSRYMPASTSKAAIVTATTTGLFFGLFTFMGVGALCAAVLPEQDIIGGLIVSGDTVFTGLGGLLVVAGGLGLLGLMAMCAYGGSLTLLTIVDSVRPLALTRAARVVTVLIIGLTGAIAAVMIPDDFLNTSFATVLGVIGYLMGPWTSINLTDFFLIRRGRYSVTEIFNREGIYGLWNWRGLTAYLLTMLIMLPFMVVGDYTGAVAEALGGVDIAFFVGIPVGCLIYWLLCLSHNRENEIKVVEHADAELELIGRPVE